MRMTEKLEQYIYVLKPRADLLIEENWTDKENEAVERHFAYLKKLKSEGILILAGKTKGMDESTFGIVVLEAEDEAQARILMMEDPGVFSGIMSAELFPYHVALMREEP